VSIYNAGHGGPRVSNDLTETGAASIPPEGISLFRRFLGRSKNGEKRVSEDRAMGRFRNRWAYWMRKGRPRWFRTVPSIQALSDPLE
jgi:hypothetical protein